MDSPVIDPKIVTIWDRLAHESLSEIDIVQSVLGLQRLLKGRVPSKLLQHAVNRQSLPKEIQHLQMLIRQLQAEQDKLEAENRALIEERAHLQIEVELLKDKYDEDIIAPHVVKHNPIDDYSYAEVMTLVEVKFKKHNGFGKLWEEYSLQIHRHDPARIVTVNRIQSWRKANAFPAWAIEQLKAMPLIERVIHRWSHTDIEFLAQLYNHDPTMTDTQLADQCSVKFGCKINDNSIKSKLNILRKERRIELVRRARRS